MRLQLRPYQTDALARVDTRLGEGVRRLLGVAATGLGKALATHEPVLTPAGWVQIADLRSGDHVIGADGYPTEVIGVYPQGARPAYQVTFNDGPVVTCDAQHLWNVRTKYDRYRDRPWRTMTTEAIAAVGLREGAGWRWETPLVAPVQHPHVDLPLDPYLLGVLLGDGGLSTPGRILVHTEDDLVETIDLPVPCRWKRLRSDGTGSVAGTWIIGGPTGRGRNPVLSAVRALGLEGSLATDKTIPGLYKFAHETARLDLLRGIMDADGHVRPGDGHVELTLANYQLAEDVARLVRSLGGTARLHHKHTTWTHRRERRHGEAWRLSIAMTICPFRWKRKADIWRPRVKYQPQRRITAIEPAGFEEMICIKVAAPDGLFVTRGYVVTHNTVIFCALAERLGLRTLILAHRDELIRQAVKDVLKVWPDLPSLGIIQGRENQVHAEVVVASVQTISRPNRLARLCPQWDPFTDTQDVTAGRPFGLIVIDEAHHAAAASYKRILDWCGAGRPGGPILYGTTATPQRGDGQGLDDVFDEIAFTYDILWGIRAGYLSDVRGQRVRVEALDLAKVKVNRGDYQVGDSGRALEAAGAPWVIAQAIRQYAPHRLTLAFLPTVATAEQTAEACRQVGLRAGCISDSTPKTERRNLLDRFRAHEVDVVANCMVLTEGFDAPRTDCVVVGRPTKSSGLYTQMIGRGTRKHPDKADCLVLDVVGASRENTLVTIPTLFGIPKRLARGATDGTASVSDLVARHEETEIRAGRLAAEAADLFKRLRTAGLAWVTAPRRDDDRMRYVLNLGNRASSRLVMVQLEAGNDESWAVQEQHPTQGQKTLIRDVDLETCQGVGEDYARIHGDGRLTDPSARWRSKPPRPKQLAAARAWHLPKPEQYKTAGELSDALTAHVEKVKSRRSRPAS